MPAVTLKLVERVWLAHVAGAAAVVRQVNPFWSVATVRADLMNTATNPRFSDGTAKANNLNNDSILAQGAGLIDVYAAAQTTSIMSVTGDGIIGPGFLASYSYGTFPMINTRVIHDEDVTVTLQGLNASQTSYNLSVANNRELHLDGIDVALSTSSVEVDADNAVEFTVAAIITGDKVCDFGEASQLEMMWYVIAEPTNGGETLRMPLYLKPSMSEPKNAWSNYTETLTGIILAGDLAGDNVVALVEGVTYQNYLIEVGGSAFQRVDDLTATDNGIEDINLFLIDPDGFEIASSKMAVPQNILKYK